jgi:hypothetical protein
VSCASAGNCSAAGTYRTVKSTTQVFVVTETDGVWGTAEEAPGLGALTKGGNAAVTQVSCGAAGDCTAGGNYAVTDTDVQAYLVVETDGTWGTTEMVPGSSGLNKGRNASVDAVSCASAGNCSVVGSYEPHSGQAEDFTVAETSGTWADAQGIPGLATLNKGNAAYAGSVSCASAGNCGAAGYYTDSSQDEQAFAVAEANGTWRKAAEIPGTGKLNTADAEAVISCAPAGDCGVVGTYSFTREPSGGQAFVDSSVDGTWGTAEDVPGMSTLAPGGNSGGSLVSCSSAGQCAAGGDYALSGKTEPYVVSET